MMGSITEAAAGVDSSESSIDFGIFLSLGLERKAEHFYLHV